MQDMGSVEGSIEAVGGGGSGGNSGAGNVGSGSSDSGGTSMSLGNTVDLVAAAAMLGGGYVGGPIGATMVAAGAVTLDANHGGPMSTAAGNLGHDINSGLVASGVLDDPGNIGLFGASMSPADFSNPAASAVASSANLGGGQIAEYSASGQLLDIISDPSWNAPSSAGSQ